MPSRRGFLAGLAAASLAPQPSWAEAGAPDYIAAARSKNGVYSLHGLTVQGSLAFSQPLPARGHAAAAHPSRPEAVAFARRPGTFALVLDCRAHGRIVARLTAPEGRHFYGHGAFSSDGSRLYTTENDYERAIGRIGIWDAADGYRRIGEIPSHGTGPHEVLRLPGSETLVVANGGIETHPSTGRTKLNLGFMEPNLAYVSPTGELLDRLELDPGWHLQSIRHLGVREDGLVAAACQWQGDLAQSPPLLILHRQGDAARILSSDPEDHQQLDGYAGSVAFSGNGTRVAISAPRGGRVAVFDADRHRHLETRELADACGVAPAAGPEISVTSGIGLVGTLGPDGFQRSARHDLAWDNHLVSLDELTL